MSLDEVKRKIIELANQKASELRKEAKLRAEENARETDNNIKKMLSSGRHRYAEDARLLKERRLGVARVEVRNKHLNAKQMIIEEVIDETLNRILAFPDDEYLAIMERLFAEANIPECECEVQISQPDVNRMTADFIKSMERRLSADGKKVRLTLSKTHRDDIKGGFVVRADQVEIDCSLDTLVRVRWDEMEHEAAQILFGGSDA